MSKFSSFLEKLTKSKNERENPEVKSEPVDDQYNNILSGPIYYRISQPFGYHIPDVNTVVDDFENVYNKLKTGFNKIRDRNLELLKENMALQQKLEAQQLMMSMMEISEENIDTDSVIQDFSNSLINDSKIKEDEDRRLGNEEIVKILNRDNILDASRKMQISEIEEVKSKSEQNPVHYNDPVAKADKDAFVDPWTQENDNQEPQIVETPKPVEVSAPEVSENTESHRSVSKKQKNSASTSSDEKPRKRTVNLNDIIE